MGRTTDLGRRVELVSMDPHFHSISIALYRQESGGSPTFAVHSYSSKEGLEQRLDFVVRGMILLAGLETVRGETRKLRFPCGAEHLLGCRRAFLEVCKLDPSVPVEKRPLSILDKKSNRTITVTSVGSGVYQVTADGEEADKDSRIAAVANGLVKLGQMQTIDSKDDRVAFSCGQPHDALVGLLLIRALNVRAVMREQEMASARGVLSAPSSQK